jgi:hypothetical protein
VFPARLHGLLARNAPAAVIIRRGPARRVCTIGWNRSNDTFTIGQWLYGRIYERRCDLSPDGKWLVYFAASGRMNSEGRGSYTAVSRAPYLKALTLWPKGDRWQGGGLFTANNQLWVNGCHDAPVRMQEDLELVDHPPIDGRYGGECPGVYYRRLQRDGWQLISLGPWLATFEKRIDEAWILRKFAFAEITREQGHGAYFDEHQLEHASGRIVDLSGWEWIEHDVDRDRIVFAQAGVLYATTLDESGPANPRALHDFNAMAAAPLAAPY